MEIGQPVIGATASTVLYTSDPDGDLAGDTSFTYVPGSLSVVDAAANFSLIDDADNSFLNIAIDTTGRQTILHSTFVGGAETYLNFPTTAGSYILDLPAETGTILTTAQKGVADGIASLDGDGLVPISQLPFGTALINKGSWNAATNTPPLIDGTGTNGDFYVVSVGATRDLGSGDIDFIAGNGVLYNGTIYQQIGSVMTGTITEVIAANGTVQVDNGTTIPEIQCLSAPKLTTARTINNVSFDGQANILLNNSYDAETASFTLDLTQNQKIITVNISNPSTTTITVPTNAAVAFPTGTRIDILSIGTGTVTIAPFDGTVAVNSYLSRVTLAGQFAACTLMKRASNTWDLVGNLV